LQKSKQQLNSNKKEAILFTVVASSLWGTSFPAIKIGLQFMDVYTFALLRFSLVSIIMLVWLIFTRNFNFNFKNKRLIILLSLINGLAYLLQFVGMTNTSASRASLLVNLSVIWVTLFSAVLLREKLNRRKVIAIIFSFFGIFLVTTNLDLTILTQGKIFGDLIVIGAGIVWAFFIIYNKQLATGKEEDNLVESTTWISLLTVIPMLMVVPFSGQKFLSLTFEAWIAIVYTAVMCWIVPYLLWTKALKTISAIASAIILLNEILVATIISIVFLKEVITITFIAGSIFIIIAIQLVSKE
jgi:drug/metabolite transporter (DMT)-like permease